MKFFRSTSRPIVVALSLASLVGVGVAVTGVGTANAAGTSCSGLSSSSTIYELRDKNGKPNGVGKIVITKKVGTANTYLVQTKDILANPGRHQISVTVKHTRANGSHYGSSTDKGLFLEYAGCLQITVKNGEYMTVSGSIVADGVKYSRTKTKIKYNKPGNSGSASTSLAKKEKMADSAKKASAKAEKAAKAKAAKAAKAKAAAAKKKAAAKAKAAAKKNSKGLTKGQQADADRANAQAEYYKKKEAEAKAKLNQNLCRLTNGC